MSQLDPSLQLTPLAETGSPLGELFRAAQQESVDAALLARLTARVAPLVEAAPSLGEPEAPTAGEPPGASVSPSSSAVVKLAAAGGATLVALSLTAALLVVPAQRPVPITARAPRLTVSAPASAAVVAPPAPSVDAPAARPAAPSASARGPSELALLSAARRALTTNPAQSLALVDAHRARFPGSALAQERDVIRLDALARLGRKGDVEQAAQQFRTQYKGSAHQRHVDEKAQ